MPDMIVEDNPVRPFRIDVPVEDLVDLRRRLAATRWPHADALPLERSLTRDEMLDDLSLYWLTNTGTSSSLSYWEVWGGSPFDVVDISIPVAVTIFPGEIYRAPLSWVERGYHNLIYWNEVDKGGHFGAWEQPELFSEEIRSAFRPPC
jgi:pimeloyl-ACP methyl ester carboxylesterase